jgi:cholesterol transport system auxiliary component
MTQPLGIVPIEVGRRSVLRWSGLLPLVIATGACQLPGGGPPPRQFQLKAPRDFPPELPTVEWALVVDPVQASASVDTNRIARTTGGGTEVEYYAGVQWVDRAPGMVQVLLIEAFRNSGKIEAVAGPGAGLRGDFVLRTFLREFQAEQSADGQFSVYVMASVGLMQMPRRNVAGTTEIESLVPLAAPGIEPIIAAFDQALGKVLRDIVVWTLTTGQAAHLTS